MTKLTAASKLADFCIAETRTIRRARKGNGRTFTIADLQAYESLHAEEIVQSITSEPDHPYGPFLRPDQVNLPIYLEADKTVFHTEEALAWMDRIRCIDDEIYVPTMPPTLAVSLDQDRNQLIASVACPPVPSPSIRLPTLHLSLATEKKVLGAIAEAANADLHGAFSEFDVTAHGGADDWLMVTLAEFSRYIHRKGVYQWPRDLPINELSWINEQVQLANISTLPFAWLATFLDTQSGEFGGIKNYVAGLQRLLIARYRAMDEEPPPIQSDEINGMIL